MELRLRSRVFVNQAQGLDCPAPIAQRIMEEYDELDTYNGDAEHDMWVDFDYNENTGELSDLVEETVNVPNSARLIERLRLPLLP